MILNLVRITCDTSPSEILNLKCIIFVDKKYTSGYYYCVISSCKWNDKTWAYDVWTPNTNKHSGGLIKISLDLFNEQIYTLKLTENSVSFITQD